MDPRIPDENEAFALRLSNTDLQAKIWSDSDAPFTTASVRFYVK